MFGCKSNIKQRQEMKKINDKIKDLEARVKSVDTIAKWKELTNKCEIKFAHGWYIVTNPDTGKHELFTYESIWSVLTYLELSGGKND